MNKPNSLLCVSMNPAVDRRIKVQSLRIGEVNRATSADPRAGGKAAHVAMAAKALGADVRWMAFLGGAEGTACESELSALEIEVLNVTIAARTRATLEIIDEGSATTTEVLEPGPKIQTRELQQFLTRFEREVRTSSLIAISGSLPGDVRTDIYAELLAIARSASVPALLDTSGEALRQALRSEPQIIKPNRQEASALLRRAIETSADAIIAAQELLELGPRLVVLSLGKDGAIVADKDAVWQGSAPPVEAASAVGSGDSFLAGWAFAALHKEPSQECLRWALACGTANCYADSPGRIDLARVEQIRQQVELKQVQ